jgi:TnpA family transposase
LQLEHLKKSEQIVNIFSGILEGVSLERPDAEAGRNLKSILETQDVAALKEDCEKLKAFHTDNYLPLVWKFYRSHRSTLFRLVNSLSFISTSQDLTMIDALNYLFENETRKSEFLESSVDISFASEKWLETIEKQVDGETMFDRRHFEVFVFSTLAQELKSGDIAIAGSEEYGDYRDGLLAWTECEPLIEEYCREVELPSNTINFIQKLKDELTETADEIDAGYAMNGNLTVDESGRLVLKKIEKQELPPKALLLESAILERMPERNLLDVLANVQCYTNLVRHFGPLSGSDPKLERPIERYLLTPFTYGCNLGPAQAARHMRGLVTPHMFSFVNRRHVNAKKLDAALVDLLNDYNKFRLPKFWGDGTHTSADGTKHDLSEQNLMAEYHIRYGGYGGIAYHHVSDLYIALFSHFISCGTWEAVYIIDGLLKNKSEIQPDTLHADTQGQTTTVFGLSYLLGIKLMPRIRNIKDLIFYRPDKNKRYKHIDSLFTETVDWELIEKHWQDLMQVVLSIKAGKILPSTLLRKLGNYSRKNRLYLAYRELGRVVRTIFLLKYISDKSFRERIHAETNKVEAFHHFAKWLNFGGEILQENDPEEQEKLIKYNNLVANALIYQNVIDQTRVISDLMREGFHITAEELKVLSPYQTAHIKRFGDYVVDLSEPPPPLDIEYTFSLDGQ